MKLLHPSKVSVMFWPKRKVLHLGKWPHFLAKHLVRSITLVMSVKYEAITRCLHESDLFAGDLILLSNTPDMIIFDCSLWSCHTGVRSCFFFLLLHTYRWGEHNIRNTPVSVMQRNRSHCKFPLTKTWTFKVEIVLSSYCIALHDRGVFSVFRSFMSFP